MTIYGDPTTNAPVFNRYAVLVTTDLAETVPNAPADFVFNQKARTLSVTTANGDDVVLGADFTANDVGLGITGTGIPGATTIVSVTAGVSAVLSADATASATVTATIAARTTAWDVVGALHEDNPFSNGDETIDESKHTAAGFGVYAKTYKNQEEVIEFTALETTLVTLGLIHDATGVTDTSGTLEGKLKQRDPSKQYKFAFQRESATEMERRVSASYAQINSITRAQNSDRAEYTVNVTIYPTALHELYDYYLGPLA